jgi:hypothetical protein
LGSLDPAQDNARRLIAITTHPHTTRLDIFTPASGDDGAQGCRRPRIDNFSEPD